MGAVDATKGGNPSGDKCFNIGFITNVTVGKDGFSSRLLDQFDGFCPAGIIDIAEHDFCPFTDKSQGRCSTDTRTRTGDDGDFIGD